MKMKNLKAIFIHNENDYMNTRMRKHNGETVTITSDAPTFHSDYFGSWVWVQNKFNVCYVAFLNELSIIN